MGNRGQKWKIRKMQLFSIQMAPIDGINQNDCWQIIFVPKSPKVVEKSRPRDHFRSFFHYFDKSDKRLNGSCIVVKFWSFLFRMSKYIVLGPQEAIGLIPQRLGYKLKIGFFPEVPLQEEILTENWVRNLRYLLQCNEIIFLDAILNSPFILPNH